MTMTSLRFALVLMFTSGFVDAYTFMERSGVFANAQTGNVILGAIDVSAGSYEQALQHLASVLAFAVGVVIAVRLKAIRASDGLRSPGLVALALYAVVLGVVAFVPDTAPSLAATVPITLASGMVLELFRSIGGLSYAPIATTGNLMRWVEAGDAQATHPDEGTRRTLGVYGAVIAAFVAGAVGGALVTDAIGVRASAVAALAVALALAAQFPIATAQ